MTVVTKPFSEKKEEKVGLPIEEVSLDLGSSDQVLVLPEPHNRKPGATLLCLSVWALMVVCVGILSGFYVYQQYARPHVRHYQGWCNIPYERGIAEREMGQEINQMLAAFLSDDNMDELYGKKMAQSPMALSDAFFKEKFEISEDIEKIDVPDFKDGRPARYIHDFNTNTTGIIDPIGNRCFVMDLDRNSVLPPASILDVLNKIGSGYYNVDMSTVKLRMHAELPALTNMEMYGSSIRTECQLKPTYKLVQNEGHLVKRDASLSSDATFAQFAGKHIEQIEILNLGELAAHEEKNI